MKTFCVDFDGVIYPNLKYFGTSVLKGPPVPGASEGLAELSRLGHVVVHSARCESPEGVAAIEAYLSEHGLPYPVAVTKPVADVYLDDRAVRFGGDWPRAVEEMVKARQWQADQKALARVARKRKHRWT